jgi:alkanesulfonate monooxygenase SsuD/methylene tetrahydromethanopterin reductase-like flavin-dependent oxidoreductase (luciferase family)
MWLSTAKAGPRSDWCLTPLLKCVCPRDRHKSLIHTFTVHLADHVSGSGHQSPGLWKHPDDRSSDFNSVKHWINLAQQLEKGKFHGMFIADVLGGYDVYGDTLSHAAKSGAQWPVNEPLSLVPAMAAATESLGFGCTISTSYEQPYHLARRLSTVDHLTGGR